MYNAKNTESDNSQFYMYRALGEINQEKSLSSLIHHFIQFESCLFLITIFKYKNLLHFLEYPDDKIISVKIFSFKALIKLDPLNYCLLLLFFFSQMQKPGNDCAKSSPPS